MANQYEAERQRLNAMLDLDQITPTEHKKRLRVVNASEKRAGDLEARREQKRRSYHRVKLKKQLLASLEQPA